MCAYCGVQFRDRAALRPPPVATGWTRVVAALAGVVDALCAGDASEPRVGRARWLAAGLGIGVIYTALAMT